MLEILSHFLANTLELTTSHSGELDGLNIHPLTSQLVMSLQIEDYTFQVYGHCSIIPFFSASLLFMLEEECLITSIANLVLSLSRLKVS